jgi:U1 small nuclear ribonucleoprotein
MTALLPPNLLRLFAPRPQPPFLKPLTKDESNRGPNRLQGCGPLVSRLREEAEEAELKQGMEDAPETKAEASTTNGTNGTPAVAQAEKGDVKDADKMDVDVKEEGDKAETSTKKVKGKRGVPIKKDKVWEMGLVGQEAIKMRRELRKKRQEEYKKNLEKNCELYLA